MDTPLMQGPHRLAADLAAVCLEKPGGTGGAPGLGLPAPGTPLHAALLQPPHHACPSPAPLALWLREVPLTGLSEPS